jgi:hypothetical protein
MQPMEVYIDDEAKLTLNGLQQHYVKLKDSEKNRKLFELLDVLEFNQVNTSEYLFISQADLFVILNGIAKLFVADPAPGYKFV